MKIKWYNIIESTNSKLSSLKNSCPDKQVVAAYEQSAGKGQRGNVWESEPRKNLTFSILFYPTGIQAKDQFLISQAVAVGICSYIRGKGIESEIKWPNDIYVGGKKICGILIENAIEGSMLKSSIAGIGININQRVFPGYLPNPTSLALLTDRTFRIEDELEELLGYIFGEYDSIGSQTVEKYLDRLYLKDIHHIYTDTATGKRFDGCIRTVTPEGCLVVECENGEERTFAFKEIAY